MADKKTPQPEQGHNVNNCAKHYSTLPAQLTDFLCEYISIIEHDPKMIQAVSRLKSAVHSLISKGGCPDE